MGMIRVASLDEVPEGEVVSFEVEGRAVCIARLEGEVYAFADKCTHRDFPLSNGELDPDDCSITCEWHGARFDIRSGKALSLPATRPVPVFASRIDNGDIYIDIG